jgi:hypothetical protein
VRFVEDRGENRGAWEDFMGGRIEWEVGIQGFFLRGRGTPETTASEPGNKEAMLGLSKCCPGPSVIAGL